MREIRTLRSMSGKRKRSAGFDTKPKPPRLFSSTIAPMAQQGEPDPCHNRIGAGFSDQIRP